MHVLRFLHAMRVFLCLGLLGLAGAATGCSESNPVESMGKDEAQAKGKAQMEARKKAFGDSGYTTKPAAPAK
jgi:hypothetical protein